MDAARAGRLRPADQPDGLERLLADQRHVADLRPRHARHRVEVHAQLVGVVEVVGADRVRVEVDAAEVDDPGQPGGLVDDDLVGGPPGREGQLAVRIQSGRLSGARFWKNGSPAAPSTNRLSAIGRPRDAAQRPVADRQVVLDEVELRVAGLREVDLARVRDRDLAAVDREDLLSVAMARHDTARQRAGRGHRRATSPLDAPVDSARGPFVVRVTAPHRSHVAEGGTQRCTTPC